MRRFVPLFLAALLALSFLSVTAVNVSAATGTMTWGWNSLFINNGGLGDTPLKNWTSPAGQDTYSNAAIRGPWTSNPWGTLTDYTVAPGTDIGEMWALVNMPAPLATNYHAYGRVYDNGVLVHNAGGYTYPASGTNYVFMSDSHHLTAENGHYYWWLMRMDKNEGFMLTVTQTIYIYLNITCGQEGIRLYTADDQNFSPWQYVELQNWTYTPNYAVYETGVGTKLSKIEATIPATNGDHYYEWQTAVYDDLTQVAVLSDEVTYHYTTGTHFITALWVDNMTTDSGHTYYFRLTIWDNKSTGASNAAYQYSLTVSEPYITPAPIKWVDGLIWILIMFLAPILINFVFPKYGLILGLILMSVVIGFAYANGAYLTVVTIVTCGAMLFTLRGD